MFKALPVLLPLTSLKLPLAPPSYPQRLLQRKPCGAAVPVAQPQSGLVLVAIQHRLGRDSWPGDIPPSIRLCDPSWGWGGWETLAWITLERVKNSGEMYLLYQ